MPTRTLVPTPRTFDDLVKAVRAALKRLQAETAAELDALLRAILDCAFKGAL